MALKPAGGKYEGVWVNELKNGDISYYINYRDEAGKPVLTFRGVIPVQELSVLRATAGVAGVWEDAQIEPLGGDFRMT